MNDDTNRRNFLIYAFDGMLGSLALVFISYESVLPVFLARLGASYAVISIIPVAIAIGANLPGILVARRVQSLPRKKGFVIFGGIGQRLPWVIVGIITPFLALSRPDLLVSVILVSLLVVMLSAGVTMPAFYDLIASTVSQDRRGILMAIRSGVGYLVGILGGISVKLILARMPFPANYAYLYMISSIFFTGNLLLFSRIREPEAEEDPPAVPGVHIFRELLSILRENRSFAWFIAAKAFLVIAHAATAFFPLYLIDRFGLDDSASGTFVIIAAVTSVVLNPVLGRMGDRAGYRLVMIVGALGMVAAAVLGLVSTRGSLAYGLIVFTTVGRMVNYLSWNMSVEYAPKRQVPTNVGVSGVVVVIISPLGLAAGFLADRFGYGSIFAMAGGMALPALLVLVFLVKEPRTLSRTGHEIF